VSIKERNRQRARNVGITLAKGDVVAFLDDDVIVSQGWLKHIIDSYAERTVGGVGGRVIPYGESENYHVQTSRSDIGKVFDSGLVVGNFDLPSENPLEVDSFIGCNMSFRRDLLSRVGGFDENYGGTGYRDDTDLCVRIGRLGCKLVYQPEAMVWHKFIGKQVGGEWLYWYLRNHTYFYFKNIFPWSRTAFFSFLYRTFFPPRDYVQKSGIRIRREPSMILKALRGLYDGYQLWRRI
jgi:GT2 family glycosyltransferase